MNIVLTFTEISQKFGPLRSQHGLASISAVLKQNGFPNVKLAYFTSEEELATWEDKLKELKPDIIGFYSSAEQFHYVQGLIERVPKGIFTICGGPHPSCYPTCMEHVPRLDAICLGEGEFVMLELATALSEGKDYTGIAGMWVRKGDEIIRNKPRPFIENLDELPYEDRELFDTQEGIDKYGLSQIRVMTTRGCPYDCTYCSNKRISALQAGRYVRFRSGEHIMGELNELNEKYQFDEIFFDDDIFMMSKGIRTDFCERYPKEIGKPFVFCGRVECCDLPMLKRLKDAGARRIDFGVESGNEELRTAILKRRMTNAQILEKTRMAQSVGLQVKTLNMVGLPNETVETHMDTVRLNQEIAPDVASIFVFFPYPGTALYDYSVEHGLYDPSTVLPEDYVSRRDSLLTIPGFPRDEIEKCFKLFGFRVFRKTSLVKAVGLTVMHSRYGELMLNATKGIRRLQRKVLKGY